MTPSADAQALDWYALRVRPLREFAVQAALQRAGIEEFSPALETETRWSDRRKLTLRPLFPSYLFARFELADPRIRRTNYVLEVLGTPEHPLAVTAAELAEVRRVLARLSRPAKPGPLALGATVAIGRGPFAGQIGIVQRLHGNARLAVTLEILRRNVNVQFDTADCKAISN